jgi:cytochrome P450
MLPGNSSVFFNVWLVISHKEFTPEPTHLRRSITRNEEVYPEPEVFNPDRFLHPSSQQAHEHLEALWGYGRRICPGRIFAETSLWLAMANIIATMDIKKAVDGDGKAITPAAAFLPGAIR